MTLSGEDLSTVEVARSRVSSVPPSIPPAGEEDSPEYLAARVLARERGVVASEGQLRLAAAALARVVARILAPALGALLGGWLGIFAAPFFLLAPVAAAKRVARTSRHFSSGLMRYTGRASPDLATSCTMLATVTCGLRSR